MFAHRCQDWATALPKSTGKRYWKSLFISRLCDIIAEADYVISSRKTQLECIHGRQDQIGEFILGGPELSVV